MNLKGRSVLVLRPRGQAEALAKLLRDRGADPVVVPAIEIQAPKASPQIDDAIRSSPSFAWAAFTSVNGVEIVLRRAHDLRCRFRPQRIAAIGPETAKVLAGFGLENAWIPTTFTTEALADELPHAGGEVLLIRAASAGPEMDERLRERGMRVRRIDAYRTVQINREPIRAAVDGGVNAVLLTSASIAHSFAAAAGTRDLPPVCCIGPATAEAARAAGLPVDAEAARHTIHGIVDALEALPDHGRAS